MEILKTPQNGPPERIVDQCIERSFQFLQKMLLLKKTMGSIYSDTLALELTEIIKSLQKAWDLFLTDLRQNQDLESDIQSVNSSMKSFNSLADGCDPPVEPQYLDYLQQFLNNDDLLQFQEQSQFYNTMDILATYQYQRRYDKDSIIAWKEKKFLEKVENECNHFNSQGQKAVIEQRKAMEEYLFILLSSMQLEKQELEKTYEAVQLTIDQIYENYKLLFPFERWKPPPIVSNQSFFGKVLLKKHIFQRNELAEIKQPLKQIFVQSYREAGMLSKDERFLYYVNKDSQLGLFKSKQEKYEADVLKQHPISTLTLRDKKTLVVSTKVDQKIYLYDLDGLKQIGSIQLDDIPLAILDFSPEYFLVGGKNWGNLYVFSVQPFKLIQKFKTHCEGIFDIQRCSKDNQEVAIASKQGVHFLELKPANHMANDGMNVYRIEKNQCENYYQQQEISSLLEYDKDKFCVGIKSQQEEESIVGYFDRSTKTQTFINCSHFTQKEEVALQIQPVSATGRNIANFKAAKVGLIRTSHAIYMIEFESKRIVRLTEVFSDGFKNLASTFYQSNDTIRQCLSVWVLSKGDSNNQIIEGQGYYNPHAGMKQHLLKFDFEVKEDYVLS